MSEEKKDKMDSVVDGDGDYDKKTVREIVDTQLLARDAREFRNYIGETWDL